MFHRHTGPTTTHSTRPKIHIHREVFMLHIVRNLNRKKGTLLVLPSNILV
jgi:hypothetical protein